MTELETLDPWPRGRLVGLTARECFDLVGTEQVGRVVYSDDHGPLALPVNFVLQDGTILFRTSPDSVLAKHLRESPTCAFEVDRIDLRLASGWSVLVRGSAAVVRHLSSAAGAPWPNPWPEGNRHMLIRITPIEVTGRRLVPF